VVSGNRARSVGAAHLVRPSPRLSICLSHDSTQAGFCVDDDSDDGRRCRRNGSGLCGLRSRDPASVPVRRLGALVYISETRPGKEFGQMAASYPNFEDWKQSNHSFEDIAGFNGTNFTVTGLGLPFRISAVRVTTNFLSVLKVRPQLGRDFQKEEEPLENSRVVIITDGFWHRFFGVRSDVVGETIRLGGVPHTIVGVLPENFRFIFGGTSDLIVPLAPTADQRTRRQSHWLFTFARLRDGVTATEADTEMKAIAAQLVAGHADTNAGTSAQVVPLREEVVAGIRSTLGVISGAAIFMFCLALANLANLMIAQSATRQREMAIRTAIGAGTIRLGRQLLAESVALAAIAAIAS